MPRKTLAFLAAASLSAVCAAQTAAPSPTPPEPASVTAGGKVSGTMTCSKHMEISISDNQTSCKTNTITSVDVQTGDVKQLRWRR